MQSRECADLAGLPHLALAPAARTRAASITATLVYLPTLPPLPLPPCRPLVFDLTLAVDNSSLAGGDNGWRVLHVYGSPNPNDTALSGGGTIMKVGGWVWAWVLA